MRGLFLTILATALSLLAVDIVLPGVELASFPVALVAAIALGVINAIVKPVLTILSFPLTLLSLGGFLLILNGLCFWLAAVFVSGFQVNGLIAFLIGPILLSIVNAVLNKYLADKLSPTGDESAAQLTD